MQDSIISGNSRYIWGIGLQDQQQIPGKSTYHVSHSIVTKNPNSRKNFFQKSQIPNIYLEYRSSNFNLNTPKLSTCYSANLRTKVFIEMALKWNSFKTGRNFRYKGQFNSTYFQEASTEIHSKYARKSYLRD